MTLADTPSHWAQVDPGQLTAEQIAGRIRRIEREMTSCHARIVTLEAILAEYRREAELLDALHAREKRRTPTQEAR